MSSIEGKRSNSEAWEDPGRILRAQAVRVSPPFVVHAFQWQGQIRDCQKLLPSFGGARRSFSAWRFTGVCVPRGTTRPSLPIRVAFSLRRPIDDATVDRIDVIRRTDTWVRWTISNYVKLQRDLPTGVVPISIGIHIGELFPAGFLLSYTVNLPGARATPTCCVGCPRSRRARPGWDATVGLLHILCRLMTDGRLIPKFPTFGREQSRC